MLLRVVNEQVMIPILFLDFNKHTTRTRGGCILFQIIIRMLRADGGNVTTIVSIKIIDTWIILKVIVT